MGTIKDDDAHSYGAGLLEFYGFVGGIKRVKRQGWLNRGIPPQDCESVGDHMYRMAIMAMTLPLPERCLPMALMHDLAESLAGDVTPDQGIGKEEKHRLEREALQTILAPLPNPQLRSYLFGLWEEYEAGLTDCAMAVKDLDKLELAMQALEYEHSHGQNFEDFIQNLKLTQPWAKTLLAELLLTRK